MPQEVASYYWGSQAPMRLLFFFVVTFYSYVFKPGGVILAGKEFGKGPVKGKAGWDDLKNSLVFTWGFVEMLVWFWVSDFYVSLLLRFWASPKHSHIDQIVSQTESTSRIFNARIRFTLH